jgi:prephenate dehydratase
MSVKVAIQGESFSFHDIAARQFFGSDIELVCCTTFTKTVSALMDKDSDYAICAVENSLYGSISEVYNLLLNNHPWIIGEVYLRINQCLIGLPKTTLRNIDVVYSHPVALAQCEEFLSSVLPNVTRFEYYDTAASVSHIKSLNDETNAAIGSSGAAELFGLKVLKENIETDKQNYTRFIVMQRKRTEVLKANKTSLVLGVPHKPGSLYRALGSFAKNKINLSKLQSHPVAGDPWHYMFYIDVEAGLDNPALTEAIENLKKQGCTLTILGSYLRGIKAQT